MLDYFVKDMYYIWWGDGDDDLALDFHQDAEFFVELQHHLNDSEDLLCETLGR